jgi:hypothetical protein
MSALKPSQGGPRVTLFIDDMPVKPVLGVCAATADNVFPPAEFKLTVSGASAALFRALIAKGNLYRIEALAYEDSLVVTFREVVED